MRDTILQSNFILICNIFSNRCNIYCL